MRSVRIRSITTVCFASVFALMPIQVSAEEHADPKTEDESEQPAKPKIKKKKEDPPILLGDPRGPVDLTVCSQNLKLFGAFEAMALKGASMSRDSYREKIDMLVERFVSAECDIIALQEVLGKNEEASREALTPLANRLREVTNRVFLSRVAPPAEGGMAVGFLVAEDRAEILNTVSYNKVELPKLSAKQKPRLFTRGPFELQLSVASKETGIRKAVTIVNFHFKSKRGSKDDPSGLEWETYRMEMAEALRRIVERRLKNAFASGDSLLMLLGDRNSNFDVASARILEGTVTLKSFQEGEACRLTKRGVPICKGNASYPQRLFSVLTGNPTTRSLPGTFVYNEEFSWLDDILMPSESLPFAWKQDASEGNYESGVLYTPKDASDHAMVYVKLNW